MYSPCNTPILLVKKENKFDIADYYTDLYNFLNKFSVPLIYIVPNPTALLISVPLSVKFFTVVDPYSTFFFFSSSG